METTAYPRSGRVFPCLLIFSLLLTAGFAHAQCPPLLPAPTGTGGDPGEALSVEHHFMHSSTHLQGFPSSEKIAAAIHQPGPTSSLAGMRTIVIVNNPSATLPLSVEIEYFDSTGALVATSNPAPIAPEGHYDEEATPLTGSPWGTVRVRKLTSDDPDFVGATLFHTYQIGIPVGGDDDADKAPIGEPGGEPGEYIFFTETHDTRIGAASMQQLQAPQDYATELFWGPLPLTTGATPVPGTASPLSWDFFNGNSPLIMVTNPNPFTINATIFIFDTNGATLSTTVALAPFQSFVDMTFFDNVIAAHNSGATFDLDALVWVIADSSVVGQGVMFDFFSDGAGVQEQDFMGRFRMGSTMLQNTRADSLVSPELVSEVGGVATNTLLGVANASFGDIGPVLVQYRDRTGTVVGAQTIPNFPVLSTLRLGPGSPGYPANQFAGSVTVSSCQPGLIGWNMKTTEHTGGPGSMSASEAGGGGFELRKAWGESLDGGNGSEPGIGISENAVLTQRKIGPLNRAAGDTTGFVPGYNHVYNNGVSNTGPYLYRFFDVPGVDWSNFMFFPGVTSGSTSFTYIDGAVPLVLPALPSSFINTRFEHIELGATGINALGGYLWQWSWYIPEPIGTGSYSGPGDIVPNF